MTSFITFEYFFIEPCKTFLKIKNIFFSIFQNANPNAAMKYDEVSTQLVKNQIWR